MATKQFRDLNLSTRANLQKEFAGSTHVKIILLRGLAGKVPAVATKLRSIGLDRPNKSRVMRNNQATWGLIFKVQPYLMLEIPSSEEITASEAARDRKAALRAKRVTDAKARREGESA